MATMPRSIRQAVQTNRKPVVAVFIPYRFTSNEFDSLMAGWNKLPGRKNVRLAVFEGNR